MKINSYNNYNTKFRAKSKSPDNSEHNSIIPNNNQNIIFGALGAGALGTAALILSKRPSAIKSKDGKTILNLQQVKIFQKEMNAFSSDIAYRKDLLKAVGIPSKDYAALRPIVGPDEYKNILKEFSDSAEHYSPGKSLMTESKDGFDMSGKENGSFRATIHMHTVHSDGKMSVQELLDQSVQYADELADKLKQNQNAKAIHAPFTIAITDHDTVEGCKEAVKIISQDPWKYRNVRVVLGCEMSVENKSIPQKLKQPIETHMLVHSINPFDEKLNTFLDEKKIQRINLIKNIINKSAQKISQTHPESAAKLKYEDSKALYPILNHGLTHVDLSTKDYVQFRTIFSECFEKNKDIQDALKLKGIKIENLNYTQPQEKYFSQINGNFGNNYWKKYQKSLDKYTSELLEITEEEASEKIVVTPEMEGFFNEVQQIANETKPNLNLGPAFVDMEEGIELVKKQKYGYMGIAHPGLTNIGQVLENPSESIQGMADVFKTFKEKGGDRALFAEMHYHYFGPLANSDNWHNSLKDYSKKAGLFSSGGLDSHGKSIFYSEK